MENKIKEFKNILNEKYSVKITVKVHTNKSSPQIKFLNTKPFQIEVDLHNSPTEGKANQELITLISKFFRIAKSNIKIIHGHRSKIKILKIVS